MAFLAPLAAEGASVLAPMLLEKVTPYLMEKLGPRFGALAKDIGGRTFSMLLDNKKRKSAKNWISSRTSKKGFSKLITKDLGNISKYLGNKGYLDPNMANIGTTISSVFQQGAGTLGSQSDVMMVDGREVYPIEKIDSLKDEADKFFEYLDGKGGINWQDLSDEEKLDQIDKYFDFYKNMVGFYYTDKNKNKIRDYLMNPI